MSNESSKVECATDMKYSGSSSLRDEDRINLRNNLGCRLIKSPSVPVAFPPCSDVLLSQISRIEDSKDDIKMIFHEYFQYKRHNIIFPDPRQMPKGKLAECSGNFNRPVNDLAGGIPINVESSFGDLDASAMAAPLSPVVPGWPNRWCLPPSCVTLGGIRRLSNDQKTSLASIGFETFPSEFEYKIKYDKDKKYLIFSGGMSEDDKDILLNLSTDTVYKDAIGELFERSKVRRLFLGDLVWLYYMESLGIFQILGVILDDFANHGKYSISNDSLSAIIMEAMVRLTKNGLSSSVRDRDSTYRRCLGWTSDAGRKLSSESSINRGFNNLFHKFIYSTLEYYKDRRLAAAIQSQTTPGRPSVATLITIGDTLELLKKSFDPFDYGRNYYNTLCGIVWAVAGMSIIKDIGTTLGIPPQYDKPYEYIPAAYDMLVLKKPITSADSESNRFILYKECAIDGRDILLDIEMLRTERPDFGQPGKELEFWLDNVEDRVEGYRTAYRSLTGVDLGTSGAKIGQQV